MRFLLTLRPVTHKPKLMWNYHYHLACWLYSIIAKADNRYSEFLRWQGDFSTQGKTFKHFTFSDLLTQIKFEKGDTGFQIASPTLQWKVSFYIEKTAESFITGLFKNQEIRLFNGEYDVTLTVERVEVLPEPVLMPTTRFLATSAMVIAEKVEGIDQYLEPTDPRFGKYLTAALIDKYVSVTKERGEIVNNMLINQKIRFRLVETEKMRSRKITIKENKDLETEVRGFRDFKFEIDAPKEVLELGLLGGFGKHSVAGFGFCEVVA